MNLLVVDDQISVVNGLVKGIDWNRLGINQVYKAFNVFEAKALFNNIPIDLLLTDIEMPGENGISLVQWVRNQNFETICIFLTAHADFDYARDAIKLGGFEYVLQPCPFYEIEAIVSRAIEKIRLKKERQKLYTCGKLAMNDDSMKKLMFHDLLKLKDNSVPLKFLISTGIFRDMNVKGYLTLFQIEKIELSIEQQNSNFLELRLQNIISDIFEPLGQKVLMSLMESPFLFAFFCYHPDSYAMPCQLYEHQVDVLKKVIQDKLKLTVIFLKGSLTDISLLYEQYLVLDTLRESKSFEQNNCYCQNTESPENSPVTVIVRYIREHPEDDITRSELAELVHLNIDYLSRIFKKETGYTLNDFIIMVKMQLAQEMIHSTVLPIGLIAIKVGYSNFSYFSKLYKKITRVSPMEDRIRKIKS